MAATKEEIEEQELIFGKFVDWLIANKGTVNNVKLEFEAGSKERGVFLTNDIKAKSTIIKMPIKCLLTSSFAKNDTAVARKLWANRPQFRDPNIIALVVHLLATRDDESHFFKPFYDTLPKDVSHFPIFWSDEMVQWLKGSTAIQILKNRKENLARDYDVLKSFLPDFFENISFHDFLVARTLVGSRNFYFKDAELIAMVPFADMLNHSVPSQTEWNYNPKKKMFRMSIVQKGFSNNEIFSSYGAKPNLHYFLYYGFVMEDNRAPSSKSKRLVPLNKVMNLELQYDSTDPLAAKRKAVLEKCIVKLMKFKKRRQSKMLFKEPIPETGDADKEIKGTQGEQTTKEFKAYALGMYYDPTQRQDSVKEVLNYFRVKNAEELQLDHLVKNLKDFNPKDHSHVEPSIYISPENEVAALNELAEFCAERLSTYPESYKENLEKLNSKEIQEDKWRKLALTVVIGEQEVYNFWREVANVVTPILTRFGVANKADMLTGALTALPQESQFEKDLHDVSLEIARNIEMNLKKGS